MQQQSPHTLTWRTMKVNLECPQGHSMFGDRGILIGTLYKNYDVRIWSDQKVKDGNEALHAPTYRLTETQCNKMANGSKHTFKCNTCHPRVLPTKKEEKATD